MASSSGDVISIYLTPGIRVAGEELKGEVRLDFRKLQKTPIEEIHVKFRGSIFTSITRQQGEASVTRRKRINLIRENISLWQKNTVYPLPGEDILTLPFRFVLPADLPPSFQYQAMSRRGTVAYSVEAVGVRTGLHFNKRELRPIAVLPYNLTGATIRDNLKVGWTGNTRCFTASKHIRRGLWGDYASVSVTIGLPEIEQLPVFAPIPITLNIVTVSKQMRREDNADTEPIFPAPPLTPAGVELKLMRKVLVVVGSWKEKGSNQAATLAGFGQPDSQAQVITIPQVTIADRVWIPEDGHDRKGKSADEKKQKGTWKQEVTFVSTLTITCPPTFDTATLTNHYLLALKIGFPGIGNDLKADIPVTVVSNMPPPGSNTNWDGPPAELDLPPTYMGATDWNHDEKYDEKGDD